MEAASASPSLHPPCLQEIGSVEGNPFYCLCCLRTMYSNGCGTDADDGEDDDDDDDDDMPIGRCELELELS